MKSELKILNKVAGITRLTVMDTLLLLPTIISESAPCSFAPIKFIVRPVALMATRFGDLFDRMQKHCAFLQMLLTVPDMDCRKFDSTIGARKNR